MPGGINPPLHYNDQMDYPSRKHNRLLLENYDGKRFYFVTFCTQDRKPVFGDAPLVEAIRSVLIESCDVEHFILYAYCFMPDHLHVEVVGSQDSANLQRLVRTFKGRAATEARKLGIRALWQKGFYDHVLRERHGPDCVAHYIFQNPVRKGLVQNWIEWPYSGSEVFAWKELPKSTMFFEPPWKV